MIESAKSVRDWRQVHLVALSSRLPPELHLGFCSHSRAIQGRFLLDKVPYFLTNPVQSLNLMSFPSTKLTGQGMISPVDRL